MLLVKGQSVLNLERTDWGSRPGRTLTLTTPILVSMGTGQVIWYHWMAGVIIVMTPIFASGGRIRYGTMSRC